MTDRRHSTTPDPEDPLPTRAPQRRCVVCWRRRQAATSALRTNRTRALASAVITGLALLSVTATGSKAAIPDACGLITEHDLAKAFALAHAVKHTTLVTQPGNAAGVLRQTCRAFAWRDRKPTNAKRKRIALLDGTFAELTIHTWVPDQSPSAGRWRVRFPSVLKKQRGTTSALFLKTLHGTRLVPPRFDADHSIAFQAPNGKLRKARGIWWNQDDKTLISIQVTQARGKPTVAPLRRIASHIVPGFSA